SGKLPPRPPKPPRNQPPNQSNTAKSKTPPASPATRSTSRAEYRFAMSFELNRQGRKGRQREGRTKTLGVSSCRRGSILPLFPWRPWRPWRLEFRTLQFTDIVAAYVSPLKPIQ